MGKNVCMRLGMKAVGERGERAIVSAMKTGKRRTHDVTIGPRSAIGRAPDS